MHSTVWTIFLLKRPCSLSGFKTRLRIWRIRGFCIAADAGDILKNYAIELFRFCSCVVFFRLKVKNNVSMKISWKFLFHRSIGSPLDAYLFFFLSICWSTKCLNILNNIGALECNKKRITLYISRYLLLVIRRI